MNAKSAQNPSLKKAVSDALGINFMAFEEDWRLRKIGNSFAFELFKIEKIAMFEI